MTYTSIYAKPLTKAERERYRRFVASLPCAHCTLEGSTQCAHIDSQAFGKGMQIKAHDFAALPLCNQSGNDCHTKFGKKELYGEDTTAWGVAQALATLILADEAGAFRIPKEVV